MEVSALRYSGGIGLHGKTPLLRLQSDERLISFVRRGNTAAFEVLVSRYHSRLLAFCRHLLGSREDAEDVLQEVMAAAFNAMLADDRPINVRPWLYRIARNRSLNHLRRIQAVGVDSMDIHLSDNGASTADKVNDREEFRLLLGDISELAETQRTALVLREMDALSYEQIAEAMETTVPSVKSLLVRARVSLAEASEARVVSCEDVRFELAEVAEGLRRKPEPHVRRHLKNCERCATFQDQLKETNKSLRALLPIGPLVVLRKLALAHLGHSAGSSATGSTAAVGSTAAAGTTVAVGSGTSFLSAGVGAIATKAAAGLAAAALVTAGAVEVSHTTPSRVPSGSGASSPQLAAVTVRPSTSLTVYRPLHRVESTVGGKARAKKPAAAKAKLALAAVVPVKPAIKARLRSTDKPATTPVTAKAQTDAAAAGRTQTQTDPTVLATPAGTPTATTPTSPTTDQTTTPPPTPETDPATTTTDPTTTTPTTTDPTTTSTDPTTTTPTTTDPTSTTPPAAPTDPSNPSGGAPVQPASSAGTPSAQ